MAEFDRVQARLLELEERLDFAERVLVQQREAGRLSGGLETR
jgi:tetrahydromethanopterin S-methyltransferase subunit G